MSSSNRLRQAAKDLGLRNAPFSGSITTGKFRPSTRGSGATEAGMLPAQRRRLILRAVRSGRGAEVVELAHRFDVSEMTVRRDLAHLAREGKLIRVHGGAVSDREEPPFAEVAVERLDAKERIGRAAAGLAHDGQTIMIDIGTTTLQLARQLRHRELTVVTSSLPVLEELEPYEGVELIALGGVVRRNYRSLVGVLAEDVLRQLTADVAFIGASGIRPDLSVMDSTMVEVPIKRGLIAAAERVVLLADAAKFSMGGIVRVCGADELHAVVTDAPDDEPAMRELVRAGVEVVHA
jgi:DeoR/GlpR family transcriptional regulator of sugar metabolism